MKDTKRRVEFFSFYDHTGIERHLERMAAKGWLLEKIGQFFWHYRRIEPKKLTFSVSFFPEATQYDPGPSYKQELFYDLCAHTGWVLAAASAQMQVFYNERENPLPIDTDPMLEVEAIHKTAKKGYFLSQALLTGVAVLNLVQFLFRTDNNLIVTLASPARLFQVVCWPALLLIIGIDTGGYFLWRHRALKAAEQGEFLPTRSHTMAQKVLLAVMLIAFVWSTSSLSDGLALITVGAVAATLAIILLITGVREVMRRRQTPAGTNKTVTIALCVVLPVLLTVAIPFFILRSAAGSWGAPADELPLRTEDLMGPEALSYSFHDSLTESPLLAWQFADLSPDRSSGNRLGMSYTVTLVKVPLLYELCRRETLGDFYYLPIDPAPWGADEAYQFDSAYFYDDYEEYGYQLCYPDRIVTFWADWEPTPEQMAIVGEKLGGVLPTG